MTVRLLVPYGDLPKNSIYSGSGEADLLRDGRADTNVSLGTVYVPPAKASLNTGLSLSREDGKTAVKAYGVEVFGSLTTGEAALYAVSKVNATPSVAQAMLSIPALFGSLNAAPVAVAPYVSTATPIYVDPDVAGPGTGTLNDPYKSINTAASALNAANKQLLVKFGSTCTITSTIVPASGGTSAAAPVIIGVYDPTTGARVTNCIGGATINCSGLGITGIAVASKNFVSIQGLNFTNNTGDFWFVNFSGTSTNGQIIDCQADGNQTTVGRYHFVFQTTAANPGHLMQGNVSSGAAMIGVGLILLGNDDNNSAVQYNTVRTAVSDSLIVSDNLSGLYNFSGVVASNNVEDATDTTTKAAITVNVKGGAPKVFRNTARRSCRGIALTSSGATAGDFSGAVVENNDCSNNEFNIFLSNIRGSWVVQGNRCRGAGSKTGAAAITTLQYGRNIELYGDTAVRGATDGTVRWNYCEGAYNWPGTAFPGSEGVGIGLDNNTHSVKVHGNYCTMNEGNAIQDNSGHSNRIFSNTCVENWVAPPARQLGNVAPEIKCEIFFILSPHIMVHNNTIVNSGGVHQLYGVSETSGVNAQSTSARVFNNYVQGPRLAGVRYNTTYTQQSKNLVVDAGLVAVNIAGAAVSAGTSSFGTKAAVNQDNPFYNATEGGACDGTGDASRVGGFTSMAGQPLAISTPIGATHAAAF